MGCTPSLQVTPTGGFCNRGSPAPPSPPCSSNHLLSGTSTNQSTPSKPEKDKFGGSELIQGQNCFKLHSMRFTRSPVKTLLVFPRDDGLLDAWRTACNRQGHEVRVVATPEEALKVHLEYAVELIVVDTRATKYLKGESFCSCIKATEEAPRCVLVAIVKKNSLERESSKIARFLSVGFNRIILESCSPAVILNDLVQLERCELFLLQQQQILNAFVTALDSCRDLVHITDAQHRIQHINKACELHLGHSIDALHGKSIWEVHGSEYHRQEIRTPTDMKSLDVRSVDSHHSSQHVNKTSELKEIKEYKVSLDISEAVNLQMRRGKEWEGLFSCRRKSGDVVNISSKVTPVSFMSRRPDYFVYWSDGHHSDRMDHPLHPRGSIKSHRKGSYDIRSLNSDGERRSSIIRRQSVAKLHTYMMEAPIARVIGLITAAQDGCPAYIAQALEKVLEILRSSELYNPQPLYDNHAKVTPADPVATDLLGALLSRSPKPLATAGRRSSNDQPLTRQQSVRPSLPVLQQASAAIKELLAVDLTWTFDVINLEKLTDKRPLVWLGMSLMCQLNVPNSLECDEQTLQNWLTLIEANYQSSNSYHNSTHAADVLQTTAYFVERERMKRLFDPLDVAACLIAAVVHDVDHPGKNSQFLCNTNNELAILYNDQCVLESHHAAVSFKLTASDDRVNILKMLDQNSYKFVRKNVIDMVLATDMAKHFEHVNKFINMLDKCTVKIDEETAADYDSFEPVLDFALINTPENLEIVKRMMIKCADINNPLRPLALCRDWAHRIANEYFNQTEEEKRLKIPVVMPQFDRNTCSIPKSQIGFIDFFIFDMFEAWDELAQIPELMEHLKENYQYWKDVEELERRRSSSAELRSPTEPQNSGSNAAHRNESGTIPAGSFDQSGVKCEDDVIVEEIS